ncbi:hypothetical protein VSDG_01043 [Cytospora chrysosperma]|uniref:Uncharacterized protein n=1 Tax=Cytospora chrysosperma TaxID=252740 RepID=A0A423WKV0_CYTCH|nr:hypothetical protein VSDG_01043 [Valsa sordida]
MDRPNRPAGGGSSQDEPQASPSSSIPVQTTRASLLPRLPPSSALSQADKQSLLPSIPTQGPRAVTRAGIPSTAALGAAKVPSLPSRLQPTSAAKAPSLPSRLQPTSATGPLHRPAIPARPAGLDGTADAPPAPPPEPQIEARSTKRDAAAAGLDDGDGTAGEPPAPPPEPQIEARSTKAAAGLDAGGHNAAPCLRCFSRSYRDRSHKCIAVATRTAKGACQWCHQSRIGCNPLPDAVAPGVREFWAEKETMVDSEFKAAHRTLRNAIMLAPPTTRREAEKQMREALYLEAGRAARAAARVRGLRHLVRAMVKGEVPVPPGSEWAVDPALWNAVPLAESDDDL